MTKRIEELAHKFSQYDTETLRREIIAHDGRIKSMQRAKAHKTEAGRQKLSELQSVSHRMNMELTRREREAKRALWNAPA